LATELPNSVLIIDEKKGRNKAKELGLTIIGTLKFIVIAKQKNKIDFAKPLIDELNKNGFRFSSQIVEQLLKEVNE